MSMEIEFVLLNGKPGPVTYPFDTASVLGKCMIHHDIMDMLSVTTRWIPNANAGNGATEEYGIELCGVKALRGNGLKIAVRMMQLWRSLIEMAPIKFSCYNVVRSEVDSTPRPESSWPREFDRDEVLQSIDRVVTLMLDGIERGGDVLVLGL